MCAESRAKWEEKLPLALFADRISTKRTTEYSPYELMFGQPAVLPVDVEMERYLGIDLEEVRTTGELLTGRMDQLARKNEVLKMGYKRMMEARAKLVQYWDSRMAHRLRESLVPGDMVLAYNKSLEDQWGKLLHNRWNEPYRVVEQAPGKSYVLEELDGTQMARRSAAAHIKRFYAQGNRSQDQEEEEGEEEEERKEEEEGYGLVKMVQAGGGQLIHVGPEGVDKPASWLTITVTGRENRGRWRRQHLPHEAVVSDQIETEVKEGKEYNEEPEFIERCLSNKEERETMMVVSYGTKSSQLTRSFKGVIAPGPNTSVDLAKDKEEDNLSWSGIQVFGIRLSEHEGPHSHLIQPLSTSLRFDNTSKTDPCYLLTCQRKNLGTKPVEEQPTQRLDGYELGKPSEEEHEERVGVQLPGGQTLDKGAQPRIIT
ncbi:hypothetical protein PPACK8108_LOCUS24425 [Phakopsora pachyrhizi]|uniref:Uncharacterized protein n=1 Tax=Phakopsora pachyrhizi TaxID=170000 RepID=A0AAV0BT10_PHAPC|nr:hypothetical protein PPACK8108_LOCUS24425 [Phakopsora pachyrhizi]